MASFFGLTHLGPPNQIKNNLLKDVNVSSFSEEEFYAAFRVIDKENNGYIRSHDVRVLFSSVYGAEAPESEVKVCLKFINTAWDGDGRFSFEDFKTALAELKEIRKNLPDDVSTEYKSFRDYKDALNRHSRMQYAPQEKYRSCQLSSQEYGWYERTNVENIKMLPKNTCHETRFQSEMIKSGQW